MIVFLLCLLFPLSIDAKMDKLVIDLKFKPNHGVKVNPKDVPAARIFFEHIKDARPNQRNVGENLEDKGERVLIQVNDIDGASDFVGSALNKEFRSKKFSVVDQAGAASKIISGTLIKFWTIETSQYNTQTQLRIEVKENNGRVYFSKIYTGTGKNRGRSLGADNYYECMSDSMASIIDGLFSDHEFLSALSEKHHLPSVEGKPAVPAVESQPIPTEKVQKQGGKTKGKSSGPAPEPGPAPAPGSQPAPAQPIFGPK
jgi:hypothetical protein